MIWVDNTCQYKDDIDSFAYAVFELIEELDVKTGEYITVKSSAICSCIDRVIADTIRECLNTRYNYPETGLIFEDGSRIRITAEKL